jgi:hypothetical protein
LGPCLESTDEDERKDRCHRGYGHGHLVRALTSNIGRLALLTDYTVPLPPPFPRLYLFVS